jgi:hypothetical protein
VADYGSGMSAEMLEKSFEPHCQISQPKTNIHEWGF